jgi:hypothetical protein
MRLLRLIADYRWPIYIGGLLMMPIVACGVLVWVATRPDAPRPIERYHQAAQSWDASEAIEDASRQSGWSVRYALPSDLPIMRGMPRPVDVTVVDRGGRPVSGLAGDLLAIRPSDTRLNQRATLVEMPSHDGRYRTLVRLDHPGAWELRLDTHQDSVRFVHSARVTVPMTERASEAGSQ